jgi:hypothetical protein
MTSPMGSELNPSHSRPEQSTMSEIDMNIGIAFRPDTELPEGPLTA